MSILKRDPSFRHRFHMDLAVRVAQLSKDPDRKVGAVLASPSQRQVSFGYNGFPPDIPDTAALLHDKQFKLLHMVHAEDNCLRQAPFDTKGCTLYITRFPCAACAQLLIDRGVTSVVAPRPDFGHLRWGNSWICALAKFQLAQVDIIYVETESTV